MVRSVKRCLKKVLGNARLTFDELLTVLVEVEATLNSRPLTYTYDEVGSEPLTPSHLVTGRKFLSMPDEVSGEEESDEGYCKKRWRKEYLVDLREFHKQDKDNTNRAVQRGDVITVYEDNVKRGSWKTGVIEELVVGKDGVVRGAKVRLVRNGKVVHLNRLVQKLFPTELKHDEGECEREEREKGLKGSLEISLNVDGLPLFKSSAKNIWPVLYAILNIKPVVVFPIVLTWGDSKPKDFEFLDEFIKDLKGILERGVQEGEKVLTVTVRGIVCDAPARTLVKRYKTLYWFFGFDKCTQKGKWLGRVTYSQNNNIELRTINSFSKQIQEEHRRFVRPFCHLLAGMVKQFLIDYMHQLCPDVIRKLIMVWMRENRAFKMSVAHVEANGKKLVEYKPFIPSTFVRKPRNLLEVRIWKAKKFRQFHLYTGKIALKGILRPHLYENFLVLSVASSILVSPLFAQLHKNYAKQLMHY
ncbi:LOW QUALITY PROTEIN: uncharacterized protein LOC124451107 [Xenia sp. Carnegie-2017]|uniref:LOW QUALITY PROTEIN: uncharacterized protein LOC124451107 n=1 Tax=Xenia sp. Carnegie-2017 TaxID=2897299 RepID=UPI001F05032A|nr:LOW QUALITY PROTEIN: uncharacterized protein LOC124451107 [Xenia sp. Carnegie-2017]